MVCYTVWICLFYPCQFYCYFLSILYFIADNLSSMNIFLIVVSIAVTVVIVIVIGVVYRQRSL